MDSKQEVEKREKDRIYHREYMRKYSQKPEHKAYRRKWASEWWKKNPEKGRKKSKDNYEKHREARIEYVREYRRLYKDKIRIADRKRMLVPQRRIGVQLRIRIWSALKSQNARKVSQTTELVGITIPELKSFLQAKFTEGMSWDNYGKWHIDHIIPLASFDLTKDKQQRKAFHYTNLQPLWAIDNMRKGAKIPN